jgi:hypothetical protein
MHLLPLPSRLTGRTLSYPRAIRGAYHDPLGKAKSVPLTEGLREPQRPSVRC